MFNLTSSKFTCNFAKLGLLNGIHYVVGEARTSEYPEMHGFDYAFINVTVAPLLAKITVDTYQEKCYYGLGTRMYLDGSGSYDRNAFHSGMIIMHIELKLLRSLFEFMDLFRAIISCIK